MITFGLSPLPLLLLALVAGALAWYTYRNSVPQLEGFNRWLLPGLRTFVLLVLLALLFEPLQRNTVRRTASPVLAVLVDESQSMSRQAGMESLPAIPGEVRMFGFGGNVRELEDYFAARDSAPRTDIGSALQSVSEALRDTPLRGVLLLSDGQHNTGPNPAYVAGDLGLPVHTVIVGDTAQQRDLRIARIATNEIAYAGHSVPVEASLLLQGYDQAEVSVSLYEGDSLLTSQPVSLEPGESSTALSFTPGADGLRQFVVTVTALEGEASIQNNRATFTTRVLKRTQRVLLLAAAPHPDVAALRSLISQDGNREVHSFVQKNRTEFYEGSVPVTLDEYDLIVLAGYPGRGASRALASQWSSMASSGTPLLFVIGEQTDLELLMGEWSGFLPAAPQRDLMQFDEATFVPTLVGLQHPVLDLPEADWAALPPLMYGTGQWEVSPDALVLARASVRGVDLQAPMLVTRSRSGSRSAALLGAGTWRWLNLSQDPFAYPRLWPQVLENLVQWLTAPDDDRKVRVAPVTATFDGAEPVVFTGQVYDESLRPVSDADVTLDITAPDGAQYPYTLRSMGSGRYSLSLDILPEGAYSYAAQATRLDMPLGTDAGTFTVGALGLEFHDTHANAPLLRQIAYRSGGHFMAPAELAELPARLAADTSFAPEITIESRDRALWRWPVIVAVLLALLSLEWVLRKRNGLV